MKAFGFVIALASLCLLPACPSGNKEPPVQEVQLGDLVGKRGAGYAYVRGNLLDCRNVSVQYLEGDVRGEKTRGVWVDVMRGTIEGGAVTVNVLEGNIVDGANVTVNVLIGEDFSGQARVARRIPPNRAPAAQN